MPNWCNNTISLTGRAKDLKEFDEKFKAPIERVSGGTLYTGKDSFEPEEGWIAYNAVPNGEDRLKVHYINKVVQEEGYTFNNFIPLTREAFLNDWYDWCVDNWGTKWDCGEYVSVTGLEDVDKALEENKPEKELSLHYTFQTAWTPCTPVVAEMARQFPYLSVKHDFVEEGCLIVGIDEYKDGALVSQKMPNPMSPDPVGEFREFLLEHFEEDFVRCNSCNVLLYEYEIEDGVCANCDSLIEE